MMFFHLLALVLTYCSYAYGDCPSGAIQGNNPDECYVIVATLATWQTAEESCQALGGHLTSIVNAYQNSFVLSKINIILSQYNIAWIGANTLTNPGVWTWTDNSPWMYSNWASGYPYSSKNACGGMGTSSGRWYDFNCASDTHPYVCGVPGTGQGQTTKSNPPSPPPVKTTANPPPPVKTTTNPPPPPPIVTTASLPGRCPNGYVYNSGFNFCYKFYNLPGYTYFQAEAVCKQYGGHLVSVHTDDENNYLNYLASDLQNAYMWASDFWIGAVYTNENVWAWDDGTSFDYSNWYQNTYEDCSCETCAAYTNGVSYNDYKQWDTVQCDRTDLGGFICKNKPSF